LKLLTYSGLISTPSRLVMFNLLPPDVEKKFGQNRFNVFVYGIYDFRFGWLGGGFFFLCFLPADSERLLPARM